ncbi:ABC transporter ATP-binding protein [Nakamurella sp. GG22]
MSDGTGAEVPGCTGLDGATVVQRDGTVTLHDITLLARPGELLAVLGPSGSGKSTLLRAIAGLAKLQSGRVLVAGRPTSSDPAQRDLAMVFERTQLMPLLDVARNMGFGLSTRKVPAPEVERRVDQQSRRLRVGKLLRRMPNQLSSGEQGQVGIGRALVRTPKAFLLDEPLAHVDIHERARMRRVIAETVRSTKVSTLYVTHDQSDALAIGDRIAVLKAGRLVQVGTPRELYDMPADLFVADFIGDAPIGALPGRLVTSGGMAGYQVGERTLPTWQPVPPELAPHLDRNVILGLRPEDVREADNRSNPDSVRLTGPVRAIGRNGRDAFLTVEIAGARLVARFPGRTAARLGDVVTITADAGRAHVFDRSGRALYHPPT